MRRRMLTIPTRRAAGCAAAVSGAGTSSVTADFSGAGALLPSGVFTGSPPGGGAGVGGEPLEERKATVGLDPKRAGVIVAGFVILEEVLALAGADAYTASESDILHGMIFEAARED